MPGSSDSHKRKRLLLAGFPDEERDSIEQQLGTDVDIWKVDNDDTLTHEMLDIVDVAIIDLDRAEVLAYRFANLVGDSSGHCQLFATTTGEVSGELLDRLPQLRLIHRPINVDYVRGLLDAAQVGRARMRSLDEEQSRLNALYQISSSLLKVSNRMHIAPALENSLPQLLDSPRLILLVFPADPHPIFYLHSPHGLSQSLLSALTQNLRDAWSVLRSDLDLDWDWLSSLATTPDDGAFPPVTPGSFTTAPISSGARTEGFLIVLPVAEVRPKEVFLQTLFVIGDLISVLLHNLDLRDRLEERAMHDGLTRLFNRQTTIEYLEKECRRSQRYDNIICTVMMDIDHFKSINDRYGHQAGDEVLRVVAQRLRNSIREVDIVGRCGGEEFIIVLVNTDLEGGRIWAERFREALEQNSITFRDRNIRITASFGVTVASGQEAVVDRLIARVDAALYEAKRAGRNCVVVSTSDPSREVLEIDEF